MKKLIIIISFFIVALFSASKAEAYYVRGYYRSNGTYVSGYQRSMPNAYTYDNYSYTKPSYSNGYGYNKSYSYPSYSYKSSWYTPYRYSYSY